MRVLLLTSHLEIGGISIYTVGLARALARRGHRPLVASSGGALVASLAADGVPHHVVPLRIKSEFHPSIAVAVGQLAAMVRRDRPDLLHAQTRVAHVVAGVVGRLTGVPVVTTAHGFYEWHWGRFLFPFWGRRVIAVSPATGRTIRRAYRVPARKVAVILNGIAWDPLPPDDLAAQAARFRQVWGLKPGRFVVGTVSRLAPAKGLSDLLEAFHQLRRQVPEAQLLFVGDGPERPNLIRQAYALGEQDHVVITGWALRADVPLHGMDCFVLPSHREAFGLAIVEAMAMAKPVVATKVGGMRFVVQDGQTGLLVPPKRPSALAAALQRVAEDPAWRAQLGRAGRARYEEQFTMDRVARDVESVYEQVLHE